MYRAPECDRQVYPEHGKKFTAFAAPTILGEIKRYFRDKGWSVDVPRDLQERALALSRQGERLSIELGRSPTVVELADALGCTVEQTVEAIDAGELPAHLARRARGAGGR